MPRTLNSAQARSAFDELSKEMPKQHLRVQFRKRFGVGEGMTATLFKRGTATATREKPIPNLLQEIPTQLVCTRILGTSETPLGEDWTCSDPLVKIGDLLSSDQAEQGLIIQGRKARIYVYAQSAEDIVYVLRVTTEVFGEEERATPKKPSRKVRSGGKPAPRSRRGSRTTRGRH